MIAQFERLVAHHRGLVTAVLVILTTALVVAIMPRTPSIFDDGLILMNGLRILDGEVPHRDFYANYGPGQPYAVAAVLSIFGYDNIFAARIYGAVMMALCVGLGFLLIIGQVRALIALFVAGVAAVWVAAGEYHLYPIYPCAVSALLSAILLMRRRAIEERWPVVLAGVCAGVVALFRYDTGFFMLLAQVLFIVVDAPDKSSLTGRIRSAFVPAFLAGVGSALAFFPFAISYLMVAPASAFVRDVIELSMVYPEMRGKPFPTFAEVIDHSSKLGIYFPFFIALLAAADLLLRRAFGKDAAGSPESQLTRLQAILAIFTGVLIYKGVNRVDIIQFMLAILPGVFLAGVIAQRWLAHGRLQGAAAMGLLGLTALPAAGYGGYYLRSFVMPQFTSTTLAWMIGKDQPNVDCPQTNPTLLQRDYEATSRYIAMVVAEDERIHVATSIHDRILYNPTVLYAHAQRKPASVWAQYDPGVQTSEPVQSEIMAELEKKQISWIVRDARWETANEPNGSAISSGVKVLDNYIEASYRPIAKARWLTIWLRKGEPAPPIPAGMKCLPTALELPHAAQ